MPSDAVGHRCTCRSPRMHPEGCRNDVTYDSVLCLTCLAFGCYLDVTVVDQGPPLRLIHGERL